MSAVRRTERPPTTDGATDAAERLLPTQARQPGKPIFEHTFAEHSYGFRPGRGAKDALRRVTQLLQSGKGWVVDADIKGYFDSIPQDKLMAALAEHIADGQVLELVRRFLQQGVMESGKGWSPTESGTPQGAVLTPRTQWISLSF